MRGAIAAFVVPLTAFRRLLAMGLLGGHSNEGQGSGPTAFPDAGDRSSRTGGGGKKMELRHPTTFRAVAKALSFTRAASQLGYAQSSVTDQIKALERDLGVPLFAQRTEGVP